MLDAAAVNLIQNLQIVHNVKVHDDVSHFVSSWDTLLHTDDSSSLQCPIIEPEELRSSIRKFMAGYYNMRLIIYHGDIENPEDCVKSSLQQPTDDVVSQGEIGEK